jgi:hypothetical protein
VLVLVVNAGVAHKHRDSEHAGHLQAQDHHDDAAKLRDQDPVGAQHPANRACGKAKRDKDQREPDDKGDGVPYCKRSQLATALLRLQFF